MTGLGRQRQCEVLGPPGHGQGQRRPKRGAPLVRQPRDQVQRLQHSAGNGAVARLLQARQHAGPTELHAPLRVGATDDRQEVAHRAAVRPTRSSRKLRRQLDLAYGYTELGGRWASKEATDLTARFAEFLAVHGKVAAKARGTTTSGEVSRAVAALTKWKDDKEGTQVANDKSVRVALIKETAAKIEEAEGLLGQMKKEERTRRRMASQQEAKAAKKREAASQSGKDGPTAHPPPTVAATTVSVATAPEEPLSVFTVRELSGYRNRLRAFIEETTIKDNKASATSHLQKTEALLRSGKASSTALDDHDEKIAKFFASVARKRDGKAPSPVATSPVMAVAPTPVLPPPPEYKDKLGTYQFGDQEKKKVTAISAAGPSSKDGSLLSVGSEKIHHQTVPKANITIFYRWEGDGNALVVFGIGGHKGTNNKKYKATWHDGTTKTINL